MTECLNCRAALPDAARYCPACGQSTRIFKRPWLRVFRELLDEVFELDGRMMTSLRLLLTRPGELPRDYNAGRRAAHTSPVRMYVVVSLVFFLVLPAILPPDPEGNPGHEFSVELYSRGMFLLLPLYALILKLFYRRHFYLEHLVYSAYLFSAMFVAFGILMALEEPVDNHLWLVSLQLPLLGYVLWYLVASLRTSYGGGWLRSTLKMLGVLLLFLPALGATIELASHWGDGDQDPIVRLLKD